MPEGWSVASEYAIATLASGEAMVASLPPGSNDHDSDPRSGRVWRVRRRSRSRSHDSRGLPGAR